MYYVAEVINPEEKLEFECDICELSYDCADYYVLLTGKKLAYFTLGEVDDPDLNEVPESDVIIDCVCHACLYEALRDEAGENSLKFKLVHKGIAYWSVIDDEREGGFL